jgi:hypothetical protein
MVPKVTLRAGLLAGMALIAAGTSPSLAGEAAHWRLFVADHGAPLVRAVDLEKGEAIASFDLKAPAVLQAGEDGRAVYALQRDGNLVSVIASGIRSEDHGDHAHLEVTEPRLLDAVLEGKKPVHFVAHDGRVTIFFDDEGTARIVEEARLLDGSVEPVTIATDAPHHGVAATFGNHVLVSVPHPEDPSKLPVGIRLLDGKSRQVGGVHSCPDLHGEASSGRVMAIACAEGLLIVEPGATPAIRLLPYPDTLPDGKVSTLRGGTSLSYFLGNFGPKAVVLIEPSSEEAFRHVPLPERRVDFAIDPAASERAYVFTEDGRLHRLDATTGGITGSLALTEPYSMDGHWSDPRPRIAIAGGQVIVTDPLKGLLRVVDPEAMQEVRRIDLGGRPFGIVAVGGTDHGH